MGAERIGWWGTPKWLMTPLDYMFQFEVDAAADQNTHLFKKWFGPGGVEEDALNCRWAKHGRRFFVAPPVEDGSNELEPGWEACLAEQASTGILIVALLPEHVAVRLVGPMLFPPFKEQLRYEGNGGGHPTYQSQLVLYPGRFLYTDDSPFTENVPLIVRSEID